MDCSPPGLTPSPSVWGYLLATISLSNLWNCSKDTFSQKFNLIFSGKKKNLSAKLQFGVQSLGQGDGLEKEMATHSSVLAWEISRTEEPSGLQSIESQRVASI